MKNILLSVFVSLLYLLSGCNAQPDKTSIPLTIQNNKNFYVNSSRLLADLKQLSSDEFNGRKLASLGSIKAQNYIVTQLTKNKVKPFSTHYLQPFSVKDDHILSWLSEDHLNNKNNGNNIIAIIEGYKYPNKYIVMSAHYDHLGHNGKDIYNGADDNASGVAALMSYAYLIQKSRLEHSVIFLFTDGEEQGLKGAYAFVEQNKQILNQIKLNINIDMIAGDKYTSSLHYISHDLQKIFSQNNVEQFNQIHNSVNIKVKKGFKDKGNSSVLNRQNWHQASDHGVFKRHNIPYLYYGVGTHKNYHSPNDTFEHVNHQFYLNATDTIFQQLLFIDKNLTSNF